MDPAYLVRLGWLPPAPPEFDASLRSALADREHGGQALRRLAMHALSEAQLTRLGRALATARESGAPWSGLTPFRLAILSNGTTGHLIAPLTGSAVRYGIDLDVLAFSYGDAYAAAAGDDARLRDFAPDAVLIAVDHRSLPLREELGDAERERRIIDAATDYLQALQEGVRRHAGAVCITQTLAHPAASTFGHAGRKVVGSLRRVVDAVNRVIGERAVQHDGVLFDVAALAEAVGTAAWFDARLWHLGQIPFAMSCIPLYADHASRLVGAMRGKSRRVLVLDLDNTLWGGIVADDGVEGLVIGRGSAAGEAFLAVQRKALELRQRGVLLAVASKNDDAQARRPFREIPEMILSEESFSAFRANWADKAANIKDIAQELSLDLDAFVLVDDSHAERALVRAFLPEVAVLEMPDDASDYPAVLDASGCFESIAFSPEDARRADLYRARQAGARVAPHDLTAYLRSLEMKLVVERVHSGNRARVAQLVNKSNQFNLTTRRFTDAEIEAIEQDARCVALALRLTDRLDDHGIISVIFCESGRLVMDVVLWVMSCRVIGRHVERAAAAFLVGMASAAGCARLRGTYIPTRRNQLVATHYANLGFAQDEARPDGTTTWVLPIETATITAAPLDLVDRTSSRTA